MAHAAGGFSPPAASESCQNTYAYASLSVRNGNTVKLVGCEAGAVRLELAQRGNVQQPLRRYTVSISGGP